MSVFRVILFVQTLIWYPKDGIQHDPDLCSYKAPLTASKLISSCAVDDPEAFDPHRFIRHVGALSLHRRSPDLYNR